MKFIKRDSSKYLDQVERILINSAVRVMRPKTPQDPMVSYSTLGNRSETALVDL